MDHLKRITEEFARQADTFDKSAEKADMKVEDRFRDALGPARAGNILDVACGPGVVTAAIAPAAASVTAFDATEPMLEKARARCAKAGLSNVSFKTGDAEALPFDDNSFDGAVNRLAVHHFETPGRAIAEMYRVLKPGGRAVIVDIVSDENPVLSELQNAIEILRDPSHTRALPPSELDRLIADAGFSVAATETWDKWREFEEWMQIVNDGTRIPPLRTVCRTLAEAGRHAGMGLSIKDGRIVFFHRWRLVAADKPAS